MSAIAYLLPDNYTDNVQPIDAEFGRMMKQKDWRGNADVVRERGKPGNVARRDLSQEQKDLNDTVDGVFMERTCLYQISSRNF